MIKDYLKHKTGMTKQTYAPVSFGSHFFNTNQLKIFTYCTELSALHFALEVFSRFFWGAEKLVIVLTDSKSLTSFLNQNRLICLLGSL